MKVQLWRWVTVVVLPAIRLGAQPVGWVPTCCQAKGLATAEAALHSDCCCTHQVSAINDTDAVDRSQGYSSSRLATKETALDKQGSHSREKDS